MKGDIAPGVIGLHTLCQQTVKREGLVVAARQKALDHEAPHLLYGYDLLDGEAPDDHGVETVEGTEDALYQPAAFWRIGIGIGHMSEIGRQSRRAVHRDGMTFRRRRRRGIHRAGDAEGKDTADERAKAPAA